MIGEKDPRRQLQGRLARERGKRFEQRIDAAFASYEANGFAIIEKTPEPMKVIRRMAEGRFMACFLKKAQPDYKGIIKGGRMVVFEAKYTDRAQLKHSVVIDTQAAYMDRYTALGARCYVIAGFSSGNVYRLPWTDWQDMKRLFGRKYITEQDQIIIKYRVPVARNDVLLLLD